MCLPFFVIWRVSGWQHVATLDTEYRMNATILDICEANVLQHLSEFMVAFFPFKALSRLGTEYHSRVLPYSCPCCTRTHKAICVLFCKRLQFIILRFVMPVNLQIMTLGCQLFGVEMNTTTNRRKLFLLNSKPLFTYKFLYFVWNSVLSLFCFVVTM